MSGGRCWRKVAAIRNQITARLGIPVMRPVTCPDKPINWSAHHLSQHRAAGLRTNEPAKNCYFVPGGVIRKNETIELAFARILRAETGCRGSHSDARLLGAFQHFYSTNRFGDPTYGTHYVVLAYELRLDYRPAVVLDSQHSESKWMTEADLISANNVHENTKAYFRKQSPE